MKKFIAIMAAVCIICSQSVCLASIDDDPRYYKKEIYSLGFDGADTDAELTKTNAAVMSSWKNGYAGSAGLTIGNGKATFVWSVSNNAPGREGDNALKIAYDLSNTSSSDGNNYLEIPTLKLNPNYLDAESVSSGSGGYVKFGFDFYTDGKSDIKLTTSRVFSSNSSDSISEVNLQNICVIGADGALRMFGASAANAIANLGDIADAWHRIEFVLGGDNSYYVMFDGDEIVAPTDIGYYSGQSFRGIKTVRICSYGTAKTSSVKYFDNISYDVYTDALEDYEPPQIRFNNFESGTDIELVEEESYVLDITAKTSYPDRIMIYLDGDVVGEYEGISCSYTYIGEPGEHTVEAEAIDALGNAGERASVIFLVSEKPIDTTVDKKIPIWSEDYEGYRTGQTTIGSYVGLFHKNGYSRAVSIDDEHGTSLSLGIEEDLKSDSGEYANFENTSPNAHVMFETDFYVEDYPATGADIRFSLIESSSIQMTLFTMGTIAKRDNDTRSYSTKEWHKLVCDFDMRTKIYSVYIDGSVFLKNRDMAAEKPNFNALNYIRCYGPAKDGVQTYIAFDNTSLYLVESYSILSIEGSDEGIVRADDKELKLNLSDRINGSGLSVENVVISDSESELRIESVKYNKDSKSITVKLKDALESGKKYKAVISGDVQTAGGEPIGENVVKAFYTEDDAALTIKDALMSGNKIKMNVFKLSYDADTAYAIITAWNGNSFKGMKIDELSIDKDVNNFEITTDFVSGADIFRIYIIDSFEKFNVLVNDECLLTK